MSTRNPLHGATAIVGAADAPVGELPEWSATQLCVVAARRALEDAGLGWSDVDGLITCNPMSDPYLYHAEMVAEYLQIEPALCLAVNTGGGTTIAAIQYAATALTTGLCQTVVISMADKLATGLTRDRAIEVMSSTGHPEFERPYGPTVPSLYALVATAHQHAFGTTSEQFAAVAVACRTHAGLHPEAQMREPITVRDVVQSRLIADPLHLLDCSLVSDGGAALVLTTAERARDTARAPVYLLGFGEGHSHEHIHQAKSFTTSAAVDSGRRAYAMAELGPADVDVALLYDCFTPVVVVELEDLGFCEKGEGGAFVADGHIRLGGSLPVNPHGGLLSHCHPGNPGSMFHLTEAVTQLRGTAGPRQVKDAEIALVHAQGGILSSHATAILAREAGA